MHVAGGLHAGLSLLVQRLLPAAQQAATAAHAGLASQPVRGYSQCDCPMLGGPTPDTVVVEYDEEEVDRCAHAVAELAQASHS
jgi:hypothetical protein